MSGFTVVNRLMLSNRKKIPKSFKDMMGKINNHPYSLNKWINSFFLLLIIGIIVFAAVVNHYTDSYLLNDHSVSDKSNGIESIVSVAKKGVLGVTFIAVFGICFVWIYTQKFILSPLNHVKNATEQIIHGKLDQTIKINAPLEIIRLYESINDLSVNLQEILLFVWNQTENSLRCIEGDGCEDVYSDSSESSINKIKNNMLELQRLVSSFTFYDVRMDEKRVVDGSDNG